MCKDRGNLILQFPPAKNEVIATQKFRTAQLGELAAIMAKMEAPKMLVCHTMRLPKLSATIPSTIAPSRRPAYCATGRSVAYFGPNSRDAEGVTMLMATSNAYTKVSVRYIQVQDSGMQVYLINQKAKATGEGELPLILAPANGLNGCVNPGKVIAFDIDGKHRTFNVTLCLINP
jgi:hypothetical protein